MAQEIIIATTRIMAPLSERLMEPVSGLIIATKIRKVRITEKWAIGLFPDFTPLINDSNKDPAKTGIRAVGDGVSDPK